MVRGKKILRTDMTQRCEDDVRAVITIPERDEMALITCRRCSTRLGWRSRRSDDSQMMDRLWPDYGFWTSIPEAGMAAKKRCGENLWVDVGVSSRLDFGLEFAVAQDQSLIVR